MKKPGDHEQPGSFSFAHCADRVARVSSVKGYTLSTLVCFGSFDVESKVFHAIGRGMELSISGCKMTGSIEYLTGGNGKFTSAKQQEVTSSDCGPMYDIIDT